MTGDRAHAELESTGAIASVPVPGGNAFVGTDRPVFAQDGEGPLRRVEVARFRLAATTITNQQFSVFAASTGYLTEAERFGWSYVFRGAVEDTKLIEGYVSAAPWWCRVEGASWRRPKGVEPTGTDFAPMPVVHVSWNDASAFAMWAGGRLPTEAEWEHAARGGLRDVRYPWGEAEPTRDAPRCHFGRVHSPALTPPEIGPVAADAHDENGYGLLNMVGNVWEWTADTAQRRMPEPPGSPPSKWLKGGSYLCHPRTCYRYRIAARICNTLDSSLGHTGFRVAFPDQD